MPDDVFMNPASRGPLGDVRRAIRRHPTTLALVLVVVCAIAALQLFRETKHDLGARYVNVQIGTAALAVRIDAYKWSSRHNGSIVGIPKSGLGNTAVVVDPADAELIARYQSAPFRWWSLPAW
jgi:hypothetical protein